MPIRRRKSSFVSVNAAPLKTVRNFIGVFRSQVETMVTKHLKSSALKFAVDIRQIIKKQRYKWKPLSERWLSYKKRHHLDPRVHIATQTYVKSIKATPRKRNGKIVSWGVTAGQPNQIHRPSGLRFTDLVRLLEFGSASRRMPPRPHWRPAWSAFIRRDAKLVARNIARDAYKKSVSEARRRLTNA